MKRTGADELIIPRPDEHELVMEQATHVHELFLWVVTVALWDRGNRLAVLRLVKEHVEQLLDNLVYLEELDREQDLENQWGPIDDV